MLVLLHVYKTFRKSNSVARDCPLSHSSLCREKPPKSLTKYCPCTHPVAQ